MEQAFPEISVIIPCKNRGDVLEKTLTALENQDCPADLYEVIVVDDQSTDSTPAIVKQFIANGKIKLEYVRGNGKSAGDARNRGIAKSIGDILLFMDADTIPEPDVVEKHLLMQYHFDAPVCIMGIVKMARELENPDQARQWETNLHLDNEKCRQVDWWKYRTANTSIQKIAVRAVGGFNDTLVAAEDKELACRLAKSGVNFFYSNEISATHYHPMNLDGYLEKGTLYGKAVACWYKINPDLRKQLVLRYGVFAPELPLFKRCKYLVRNLFINRLTIPILIQAAQGLRHVWFLGSEILYKSAFRFRTRQAFSSFLKGDEFNKMSFEV